MRTNADKRAKTDMFKVEVVNQSKHGSIISPRKKKDSPGQTRQHIMEEEILTTPFSDEIQLMPTRFITTFNQPLYRNIRLSNAEFNAPTNSMELSRKSSII